MIKKMTNKEYHAAPGLSKSMMDKLKQSPAHFKYWEDHKEEENQTEAMLMGSLLHTLVLEPKLLKKEYAILPDLNRRTNEGKTMSKKFLEQNKDKTIITQGQFEEAVAWANAIKNHSKAKEYLKSKIGMNEVSIFWRDEFNQEICKARLDRVQGDCIIDIKSAASAQQDDFQRKAFQLGYHRQAYWFSEAFEQQFGRAPEKFVFIVVEKTPPYNVVVYVIDEFAKEIGGKECRELLDTYHYCKESNNWYGYDGMNAEEQTLALPNYVIAKNMEEI